MAWMALLPRRWRVRDCRPYARVGRAGGLGGGAARATESRRCSRSGRSAGPPVAWVSCERVHDDPVFLWTAVVAALSLVGPLAYPDPDHHGGRGTPGQQLTRTIGAVHTTDHAGVRPAGDGPARGPRADRGPAWLAGGFAAGLGVARSRFRSRWHGCGSRDASWSWVPHDLAMSRKEGSLLLRAEGVELTERAAVAGWCGRRKVGRRRCTWPPWASERVICQRTRGWMATIGCSATTCGPRCWTAFPGPRWTSSSGPRSWSG